MLGSKFSINKNLEMLIGRGNNCKLNIPSTVDPKVSREHCKITVSLPKIYAEDLKSTNGTSVNGTIIDSRIELKSGDSLIIGDTKIKVKLIEPVQCLDCQTTISEHDLIHCYREGSVYLCDNCYENINDREFDSSESIKRTVYCSSCGNRFEDYVPWKSSTPYICKECKSKSDSPITLKEQKIGGRHMLGIEHFEIIELIGQGGMGNVYKAKHLASGEVVALKVMLASVAQNKALRYDFLREMEHTRILFHPNIVRLLHTNYKTSEDLFFTMEYCDGGNVYDLVALRQSYLELDEVFDIVLPCLDALDYAHEIDIHNIELNDGKISSAKGLVHRDIKPSNIFLSHKAGKLIPKIADFGLAKAYELSEMAGNTMIGAVAGSHGYIPRQQVMDFKFVKPEVDVWAMAATMYFMITRRTPRDFTKDCDDLTTVLKTEPVKIRERRADIPECIAEVIDLALIDSHSLYFKTAREFHDALKEAYDEYKKTIS